VSGIFIINSNNINSFKRKIYKIDRKLKLDKIA